MDLQPNKFAETYKKKDGGKEEKKKDKNVFPCTVALELRRRRHLMHASRETDVLVSQKQFYFQDQGLVKDRVELRRTPRPRHAPYLGSKPGCTPQSL